MLGAACPMLQSALEDMAQVDQDEMTVIIPDTNREDLTIFANSLYNIDKTNTNYSSLMHLINFESHSSVDLKTQKDDSSDQDYHEEEDEEEEEEENYENDASSSTNSTKYSIEEINNIISKDPKRIKYEDAAGKGKHTKVWKSYKQIRIDKKKIPFLMCKICGEIFLQSSTSSSTAIKKHAKIHTITENKQGTRINSNLGLEDVQRILQSEPGRVTQHQNSSSSSEIWNHFSLLSVDGVELPYVKCDTCGLLLSHNNSCPTNSLKKHQLQHDRKGREQKKFNICLTFVMIFPRHEAVSWQKKSS